MSNSTEATNNTSLTEALKFWPVYVVIVGGAIVGAILTVIKCFCPQRWKSLKETVQCWDKKPNKDTGNGGVTDEIHNTSEDPDINLPIIPVESPRNEIEVTAEISINGGIETDPLLFAGSVPQDVIDTPIQRKTVEGEISDQSVPKDELDAPTRPPYYPKTENPERERSVHQLVDNDLNRFPLRRVTEQELDTFAGKLDSNWRSFIRNLGVKDVDMYQATGDSNMIVHEQIFKCLMKWRTDNGNNATVRELANKCCDNKIDIDAYHFLAF